MEHNTDIYVYQGGGGILGFRCTEISNFCTLLSDPYNSPYGACIVQYGKRCSHREDKGSFGVTLPMSIHHIQDKFQCHIRGTNQIHHSLTDRPDLVEHLIHVIQGTGI